jgi:RNA binding protein fox-1
MYNGVLTLKLPTGVVLVGFADDIVLSVTGEMAQEVEMLAAESIGIIETWMDGIKLKIAHHKTEVLSVSNSKAVQRVEIFVGEHAIASKRELKYLGVMIDDRLNFNSHVDYACEKAAKAINALSRIMPNIGGPRSSKRRLLASVSSSILRYGVPAWGTALKTKRNRKKLNSTFRFMAMRVASAYRTISLEAVCLIAGMIPICITLEEDIECYERRTTSQVRTVSIAKW